MKNIKTKFRVNLIIEGECDGELTTNDIIEAFRENLVMYFPDDGSVSPPILAESIFGVSEIFSCSQTSQETK